MKENVKAEILWEHGMWEIWTRTTQYKIKSIDYLVTYRASENWNGMKLETFSQKIILFIVQDIKNGGTVLLS